jgi:hypothetical protein
VNPLASRLLLACVVGGVAVAITAGPANARRATGPDPLTTTPTPAPLYDLQSPPPTVDAAGAIDACSDDVFLAYRAVPMPTQHLVTICGLVTSGANAEPANGRGGARPSFYVDVDGTQPIAVTADGAAVSAKPGDVVVVRGRYHRENGGGEGIDSVHAANGRGWAYDGFVMVNGQLYR